MADVDMADAPVSAPAGKKERKPGPSGEGDSKSGGGKKRFEVKKVPWLEYKARLTFGPSLTICSGMPLHCGPGILLSITVPSAETTSWTCVRALLKASLLYLVGPKLILVGCSRYRMSSKPGIRDERRVHRGMGHLQCECIYTTTQLFY